MRNANYLVQDLNLSSRVHFFSAITVTSLAYNTPEKEITELIHLEDIHLDFFYLAVNKLITDNETLRASNRRL